MRPLRWAACAAFVVEVRYKVARAGKNTNRKRDFLWNKTRRRAAEEGKTWKNYLRNRIYGKMLSLYSALIHNVKQGCFGMLSWFFHKKSGYSVIKRKQDALIEMYELRKTPRNAAGKSYEAGGRWKTAGKPEDRMPVMQKKTTRLWNNFSTIDNSKLKHKENDDEKHERDH